MCRETADRALRLTRAARALTREHEGAIIHALYCEEAGMRGEAHAVLYAAGYTEDDFLQEVWNRLCAEGGADVPGQ